MSPNTDVLNSSKVNNTIPLLVTLTCYRNHKIWILSGSRGVQTGGRWKLLKIGYFCGKAAPIDSSKTLANLFKMKFTLDKQDKYALLSLEEENLNSLIAPDLKSEFVFLRNEGVRNLIFDLTHVKYVDSSGLSAILTANRLWKDYGSYVITGIAHPSVEKLIKISRLDTILAIIPTVTEAIDYVFMEEAERQMMEDAEAPSEEE